MIEFENNNWLPLIQDLTLQEAETIALSILKQVMEEKVRCTKLVSLLQISVITQQLSELLSILKQVTPNNVDIAKVAPNYHLYTPSEVGAVIARL
jgi:20S proteasome subunit alpha 5